nr:cyclin-dependent kinase inhibitor 1C-like [Macaca fascicularis]
MALAAGAALLQPRGSSVHESSPAGAGRRSQVRGPGSLALLSPHPHQARAHPEPAPASERRAQPQLPPAPLPPHLEPAEGAGSGLGQPQRGAPTAQPRAEGLLERGQSGRRGRGGAQSERGLPARCHLSMGDEGRKPYHDAAQSPPQKLTRQPPDLGLHSLQNCKR